jgi:hypothetical protein
MLITMLQCVPTVRRDIQLCRDYVARQIDAGPPDCELEIQRGIDDVRAFPWVSKAMPKVPTAQLPLRRRTTGRFVIVYHYLPPIYPCVPAVVVIRTIRPIRAPSIADRLYALPSGKPIDEEGNIDWDDIIATTEADDRAGRFAFNSDDYPTWEEAMKAMHALVDKIWDEALNRVRSTDSSHAKG